MGAKLTSPPAIAHGWLYAGLEGGQLGALDLRSGQKRSLSEGHKGIVAAPAVAGQRLFEVGRTTVCMPWSCPLEKTVASAVRAFGRLASVGSQ